MKNFLCDCGHTTHDHEMYEGKPCLIEPCPCRKMNPGVEVIKVKKHQPMGDAIQGPKLG